MWNSRIFLLKMQACHVPAVQRLSKELGEMDQGRKRGIRICTKERVNYIFLNDSQLLPMLRVFLQNLISK